MKETILQFGTGNFLRGFVDAFVDQMNKAGLYEGKVVVCQNIPGSSADRLNAQECRYHLMVRGIENGQVVNETQEIASISRAVNPYADYDAFLQIAENPDLRFVVSNTTEAGIAFDPTDKLTDRPQKSFPGKLTALLYHRYQAGLPGLVFLPCELIDHNADQLKQYLLDYAALWQLPAAFSEWIAKENHFCNTLVDRIVTGYDPSAAEPYNDPLFDSAEVFHLWVIEGNYEDELPLAKAGVSVVWTDDVAPYKKRKVRVLNGGHTSMVLAAHLCGLETVGDCCKDPVVSAFLKRCIYGEILPLLQPEDAAFADAVLDRFSNPFLHHRLLAIALNSVSKFKVRVLPSILEHWEKHQTLPKALTFSLAALIAFYRTDAAEDLPEVVSFMKTASVAEILARTDYWDTDLSWMQETIDADLALIAEKGMKGAMQCLIA
jgi:tagaturonate reductase